MGEYSADALRLSVERTSFDSNMYCKNWKFVGVYTIRYRTQELKPFHLAGIHCIVLSAAVFEVLYMDQLQPQPRVSVPRNILRFRFGALALRQRQRVPRICHFIYTQGAPVSKHLPLHFPHSLPFSLAYTSTVPSTTPPWVASWISLFCSSASKPRLFGRKPTMYAP